MLTEGLWYRCRAAVREPAWIASAGQRWMHPQQSSQWCFQTGFPSVISMFPPGKWLHRCRMTCSSHSPRISGHPHGHGMQTPGYAIECTIPGRNEEGNGRAFVPVDYRCTGRNLCIGRGKHPLPLLSRRGLVHQDIIARHFNHEPCIQPMVPPFLKDAVDWCNAGAAPEPPNVTTENVYFTCERSRPRQIQCLR